MSSWDFRKEGTQVVKGANTVAGMKAGYQPFYEAGNMASKRNVISTTQGWVRRVWKGARKQEEVLVAAAPGSGFYYTSNAYLHFPDIAQMYVKLNANGVISANVSSNLYVIFNSPIKVKASSNLIHLVVANTVGGNTANAHIVTQGAAGNTGIGANNTLGYS